MNSSLKSWLKHRKAYLKPNGRVPADELEFIEAYIKEGILFASEGQVKGRTIPLIQESDLKEFSELHEKKIWEDRLSQRQYYNKKAKERYTSTSLLLPFQKQDLYAKV